MKKSVIINTIEQALDIKDLVDAFLVPIEDLSVNYEKTFSIEDIKKIKKTNKEIFVIVNKNIHNDELDKLKKLLLEIDRLEIKGIIFYDIAIVNLKEKLNLKTNLVWNQEHLTTNYKTVNFWFDKGVKYTYLSSELTKKEIDDIKENTKAQLFVNVFGYLPMFTSKRHLVNNYIDYFNLKENKKSKTIYKENKHYKIVDNINGTVVYADYILNALDQDFNKIDYLVYNSNYIDENDFKELLINKNKFPFNHGFLYQETIYKVK